jgi:cell division protein FtsX
MRRSNLATIFYLAVVFLSGAVVGGFAVRLYMANSVSAVVQNGSRNHAELRRQYIQEMQTRLHLSADQIAQLQQICDASGQRMHDSRKAISDEHVQKVIAMLNDSQKAEYAKLREEREKRRQEQAGKK